MISCQSSFSLCGFLKGKREKNVTSSADSFHEEMSKVSSVDLWVVPVVLFNQVFFDDPNVDFLLERVNLMDEVR